MRSKTILTAFAAVLFLSLTAAGAFALADSDGSAADAWELPGGGPPTGPEDPDPGDPTDDSTVVTGLTGIPSTVTAGMTYIPFDTVPAGEFRPGMISFSYTDKGTTNASVDHGNTLSEFYLTADPGTLILNVYINSGPGTSMDLTITVLPNTFGPNNEFTWYIPHGTKELVIGGEGALPDYPAQNRTPWTGRAYDSVTISDGITGIGAFTFRDDTEITSLDLPSTLRTIGGNAFRGCTGLTSVPFDGITGIGVSAFEGCTGLTSASFPDTVASLGEFSFYGCTSLRTVAFGTDSASIGNCAFEGCTSLSSLTLGGIFRIDSAAFRDCTGLAILSVPGDVRSIGYSAFEGCTALSVLNLYEGLETIGSSAFSGCSALPSLLGIPESVTSIGDGAFSGCGIFKVFLPNSAALGSCVFDDSVSEMSIISSSSSKITSDWAAAGASVDRLIIDTSDPVDLSNVAPASGKILDLTPAAAATSGNTLRGSDGNTVTGSARAAETYTAVDGIWTSTSYVPPEYWTLSFDANGLTGSMAQISVGKGSSAVLPESAFTASASRGFTGWKVGNTGPLLAVGSSYTPMSDITLYAQWETLYWTVSYDANGGSGEMPSASIERGSPLTLPGPSFTPPSSDMEFEGWKADTTGALHMPDSSFTPSSDVIFFALWTPIDVPLETVTVSFDLGLDGLSLDPMTVELGGSVVLPEVPMEYYQDRNVEFIGWTVSDLIGQPGTEFRPESDLTFTAMWNSVVPSGSSSEDDLVPLSMFICILCVGVIAAAVLVRRCG